MKDLLKIMNEILISRDIDPLIELDDNLNLRDDIGFDSFMLAELTVDVEDQFGIDIFENGIVNTIKEIKDILNG